MFRGSNYSVILGVIILGLFATTQSALAIHQPTHMPYVLTTGSGEGTLTVGVDGYGAFGGFVGDAGSNAVFEPVGSPAGDTTVQSGIAIRTINQDNEVVTTFLASGDIFGTGNLLPNPAVSGTPTMGTSSFSHLGLNFELLQIVTLTASGTTLTQTYTITNPQGSPAIDFSLIRYIDGDLQFVNLDVIDGGGRLVLDGTEILFETDETGTSSEDNSFVGITSEGGTEPATNRFEINSFPNLGSGINAGNSLGDLIFNDIDADQFIDGTGYDVSLALRNEFSLVGGESVVYVTKTVFGSGAPEDVEIDPPVEEQIVGGIILPIDTMALLIVGAQFNAFFILSTLTLTGAFAFGVLYYKTKRTN